MWGFASPSEWVQCVNVDFGRDVKKLSLWRSFGFYARLLLVAHCALCRIYDRNLPEGIYLGLV